MFTFCQEVVSVVSRGKSGGRAREGVIFLAILVNVHFGTRGIPLRYMITSVQMNVHFDTWLLSITISVHEVVQLRYTQNFNCLQGRKFVTCASLQLNLNYSYTLCAERSMYWKSYLPKVTSHGIKLDCVPKKHVPK